MTKRKDEIGTRLDKLALNLIESVEGNPLEMGEEGIEQAVSPAHRLDVFKAVSAYYTNMMKIRAKLPPEKDENEPDDFGEVSRKLKLLSGGKE